jgi:hypothetical protein
MTKFKIFNIVGISTGFLMYFNKGFVVLPLLYIYIVVALNYELKGYKFIREWFFQLIFLRDIYRAIRLLNPLVAYPILVHFDLQVDMVKEYCNRGHDKFVNWFTNEVDIQVDLISTKLTEAMFSRLESSPERYSNDPETDKLMREAMSEEFTDIAAKLQHEKFLRSLKLYNISRRHEFIHKASNKKRVGSKWPEPVWTKEDERRKRDFIMNDLKLWGNEMGKKVLREMEEEDAQEVLLNDANKILGNYDYDNQV